MNAAFGKCDPPFILHSVCEECNKHFSGTIDLRLARASYEGLIRHNILSLSDPRSLVDIARRLPEITLDEPGIYQGLVVEPRYSTDSSVEVVPVPQIGFQKSDSGEWISFRLSDLKGKETLELPDYKEIRVYAPGNGRDEAEDMLRKLGVRFRRILHLPPPDFHDSVWVEVTWTVNTAIRQCMAKIAFNYAAFAEGTEFVLRRCFDPIRDFIRHGKFGNHEFVRTSCSAPDASGKLNGHYVALRLYSDMTLLGYVSLFNTLAYTVLLASRYDGIYWRLAHGRYIDPVEHTVQPISNTLLWMPQLWIPAERFSLFGKTSSRNPHTHNAY